MVSTFSPVTITVTSSFTRRAGGSILYGGKLWYLGLVVSGEKKDKEDTVSTQFEVYCCPVSWCKYPYGDTRSVRRSRTPLHPRLLSHGQEFRI